MDNLVKGEKVYFYNVYAEKLLKGFLKFLTELLLSFAAELQQLLSKPVTIFYQNLVHFYADFRYWK